MLADIQVEEVWNPFNNSYIAENRINTVSSPQPETTRFIGTLGLKRYELCNHLGNVQAVITDRTLPHENDETIDFYIADLLSATDYYPFGMVLPGRSLETDKYRFGFNGKEFDKEFSEGSYDFGARIYDDRVARWLKVDPMAAMYPFFAPYIAFGNAPIFYTDPGGETLKVATEEGRKQVNEVLTKTFGNKAVDLFKFDGDNLVVKDAKALEKLDANEKAVAQGAITVINSKEVTEIVFQKTADTDGHGGEATITIHDNTSLTQNTIYVDPVENFKTVKITNTKNVPMYRDKFGRFHKEKVNPRDPTDLREFDHYKEETEEIGVTYDSKAARVWHGVGHVLHQKANEQENVIQFDNKARSTFKAPTTKKKDKKKYGDYKPAPEPARSVDEKHKNKP